MRLELETTSRRGQGRQKDRSHARPLFGPGPEALNTSIILLQKWPDVVERGLIAVKWDAWHHMVNQVVILTQKQKIREGKQRFTRVAIAPGFRMIVMWGPGKQRQHYGVSDPPGNEPKDQ